MNGCWSDPHDASSCQDTLYDHINTASVTSKPPARRPLGERSNLPDLKPQTRSKPDYSSYKKAQNNLITPNDKSNKPNENVPKENQKQKLNRFSCFQAVDTLERDVPKLRSDRPKIREPDDRKTRETRRSRRTSTPKKSRSLSVSREHRKSSCGKEREKERNRE